MKATSGTGPESSRSEAPRRFCFRDARIPRLAFRCTIAAIADPTESSKNRPTPSTTKLRSRVSSASHRSQMPFWFSLHAGHSQLSHCAPVCPSRQPAPLTPSRIVTFGHTSSPLAHGYAVLESLVSRQKPGFIGSSVRGALLPSPVQLNPLGHCSHGELPAKSFRLPDSHPTQPFSVSP